MRKSLTNFVFAASALALAAAPLPVRAQPVPSVPGPYNIDLGAVLASAQRVAGTYNSANQSNLAYRGVVCTLSQTLSSGSPSTTFAIQGYDAATATWETLKSSAAITGYPSDTAGVPYPVAVLPGIAVSSLPTNYAAQNVPLPRVWRVQMVVGSGSGASTPASTNVVGCNYIK